MVREMYAHVDVDVDVDVDDSVNFCLRSGVWLDEVHLLHRTRILHSDPSPTESRFLLDPY
jgi:hypothetical protein